MNENAMTKMVRDELKAAVFGFYSRKTNDRATSGVPDTLMIAHDTTVQIEFKRDTGITKLQLDEARRIRYAGGLFGLCTIPSATSKTITLEIAPGVVLSFDGLTSTYKAQARAAAALIIKGFFPAAIDRARLFGLPL